jgi:Carboxypeptidase regulatory-like domain
MIVPIRSSEGRRHAASDIAVDRYFLRRAGNSVMLRPNLWRNHRVVADSSGGLVVGATVTVTNPETGVTRTATTNTAGNYTFPSLLPGVYSVKSEMQGFQAEIHNGVELQVQQVARTDFQLKVGSMAETIRPNATGASTSLSNPTTRRVVQHSGVRFAAARHFRPNHQHALRHRYARAAVQSETNFLSGAVRS